MVEKGKERKQQNKEEYFLKYLGRQWGWGNNIRLAWLHCFLLFSFIYF